MKTLKELLEKYEIENIEEFEPRFYTMNLNNASNMPNVNNNVIVETNNQNVNNQSVNNTNVKKTYVTTDNKPKKKKFNLNLTKEFKIALLIIVILFVFVSIFRAAICII